MKIEGVSYNVNWKNFSRGSSIFIPCLDCIKARASVMNVTKRLRINILTKIKIEDGVKGLRIWRI